MSHVSPVRPTDPAVRAYHDALKTFARHLADHEGATETAFSRLLTDTARPHGLTLIPKKSLKVGNHEEFTERSAITAEVEAVIALADRSLYRRPTEVVSVRRTGSSQPRATPWAGPIPTPA